MWITLRFESRTSADPGAEGAAAGDWHLERKRRARGRLAGATFFFFFFLLFVSCFFPVLFLLFLRLYVFLFRGTDGHP